MAKVGTAYVDIVGNFAPLQKQMKSSSLKSRFASFAKVGALATAAIGVAAVKAASDFDDNMQKVRNLVGASQKQVDQWGKDLIDLAPKVGKSPAELSDALYFVSSAGIKASKVLDVTRIAAKGASLGLGDTATVADALTSAMNAYEKQGLGAAEATNVLIKTVKFGKLEADELAGSIGRVIPIASKLKVPFADVGAGLATMSLSGLDAAESTTALRAIMSTLIKPSAEAADTLNNIGLDAGKLREMVAKPGGLLKVLELLDDRFHGNVEEMGKVFPNVRALTGVFNLLNQDTQKVHDIFGETEKKTGDLGKSWKEFKDTPAQQMREGIASIQAVLTELGLKIIPVVGQAFKDFGKILTDPNLTVSEKFSELLNRMTDAVANAAPDAAKAALEVGKAVASGIVRGFIDADLLGKAAIATALISFFGGKNAWKAIGGKIGGTVTKAIAPSIATPAAIAGNKAAIQKAIGARVAATQAATTFGGRFSQGLQGVLSSGRSKLSGFMTGVGNRMGSAMAIAMGGQIAASLLPQGEVADAVSSQSSVAALGALIKGPWGALGAVAANTFGHGLGAALTEGRDIAGQSGFVEGYNDFFVSAFSQIGINAGQSTAEQFAESYKQELDLALKGGRGLFQIATGRGATGVPQVIDRATAAKMADETFKNIHTEFKKVSAKEEFGDVWQGMTPDERDTARDITRALNQAAKLASQHGIDIPASTIKLDPKLAAHLAKELDRGLNLLKSSTLSGMADITRVFDQNLKDIDKLYPHHGKKWRQAMAQNMRAQAGAIAAGIKDGEINMKDGMNRIEDLIRKANLIDPTKKQAQGFARAWAKGLDTTKEFTQKGVQDLIKNLGKLPPAARQIAAKTALNHLEQAKREHDITDKEYDKMRSSILSHYSDIEVGGRRKTTDMASGVSIIVKGMVDLVSGKGGFGTLSKNINAALNSLGVKDKNVNFNIVKAAGKIAGAVLGSRQGGEIHAQLGRTVPGRGSGDIVDAAFPPGTFILNRTASRLTDGMFQDGGMVRAKVEPGERYFLPGEVKRVGLSNLKELNSRYSRFQNGGEIQRFAQGGGLDFALGPYTVDPIQYAADHAGANSHVHISAFSIPWLIDVGHKIQEMGNSVGEFQTTSAGNPFHFGPVTTSAHAHYPTDHYSGHAVDVNSASGVEDRSWVASIADVLKGGVGAAVVEKLAKLIMKGPEPMRSAGQAGLDMVREAGDSYLAKFAPTETGGVSTGTFPALPGGWHRVGATYEGLDGNMGAYGVVGGMGFAELLQAGANAGAHPNMSDVLGYGGDMPPHTRVQFRMPGASKAAIAEKNDIGSGQSSLHYLVDIQTGLMNAIGWHPNEDVEIKKAKLGGLVKALQDGGLADFVGGHTHGDTAHDSLGSPPSVLDIVRRLRDIKSDEYRHNEMGQWVERLHKFGQPEHRADAIKDLTQKVADDAQYSSQAAALDRFGLDTAVTDKWTDLEHRYTRAGENAGLAAAMDKYGFPKEIQTEFDLLRNMASVAGYNAGRAGEGDVFGLDEAITDKWENLRTLSSQMSENAGDAAALDVFGLPPEVLANLDAQETGADISAEYASRASVLQGKVFEHTQEEWLKDELTKLFGLRNSLIQSLGLPMTQFGKFEGKTQTEWLGAEAGVMDELRFRLIAALKAPMEHFGLFNGKNELGWLGSEADLLWSLRNRLVKSLKQPMETLGLFQDKTNLDWLGDEADIAWMLRNTLVRSLDEPRESLGEIQGKTNTEWLHKELEHMWDKRNTYVKMKGFVEEGSDKMHERLGTAREKVHDMAHTVNAEERDIDDIQDQLDAGRAHSDYTPAQWKAREKYLNEKLDEKKAKLHIDQDVLDMLKTQIEPGIEHRMNALDGMDRNFDTELMTLQGAHNTNVDHDLPGYARVGGEYFDVQSSLKGAWDAITENRGTVEGDIFSRIEELTGKTEEDPKVSGRLPEFNRGILGDIQGEIKDSVKTIWENRGEVKGQVLSDINEITGEFGDDPKVQGRMPANARGELGDVQSSIREYYKQIVENRGEVTDDINQQSRELKGDRKDLTQQMAEVAKDYASGSADATAELMDRITDVQGLGSPMDVLSELPPIGVLGGRIFDVQQELMDLSNTDGSGTESARNDLLQQLLDEANQRANVLAAQQPVIREFGAAFAGTFASGGFIPPGGWGVTGEYEPEIVRGGRTGATVAKLQRGGPVGADLPGAGGGVEIAFKGNVYTEFDLDEAIQVRVDGVLQQGIFKGRHKMGPNPSTQAFAHANPRARFKR